MFGSLSEALYSGTLRGLLIGLAALIVMWGASELVVWGIRRLTGHRIGAARQPEDRLELLDHSVDNEITGRKDLRLFRRVPMREHAKHSRFPRIGYFLVALVTLTVLAAVACGSSGEAGSPLTGDAPAASVAEHANEIVTEETHGGHPAIIDGAREVTLTATEWEFSPVTITARVSEPVTLVLENRGDIEHDVEIAAFGLHLHAPAGGVLNPNPPREGVWLAS